MQDFARRASACACCLLFCFSLGSHADDEDAVIVTATRTARTVDETLAATTVITRQDIVRLQAQSVQELLSGTPGASIANSGGEGKLTSLFLRGSNSSHVLVLIDGVKVGSASSGTTPFENIPIELVDRIEIVRGPRSSLYGSEAIGGVVQIFTRRGAKGDGMSPNFSTVVGSDRTFKTAGGISAGGADRWFNANISHAGTNGFNSCDGTPAGAGCFTDEPDDDAYRTTAGNLSAGWRFDNGAEFDARWLRALGKTEYDGSFQNESDTVQQVLGARLRFSPLKAWMITLSAGQNKDESDNFHDGDFAGRFDTRRDSLSWQNDFLLSATQTFTVGADWQEDEVDSTEYDVDARDNIALFGQYQARFGAHDLQLAGRHDDNEQFGAHNTGSVAWGYALTATTRVMASYGTAFKAPTFNDLYFPFLGNPELSPEESKSLEVGINGKYSLGGWALNAFETRIDELIVLDASFLSANIDEARIRGLEAVLDGRILKEWRFNMNVTLLDPENRSDGANKGNLLPRRPEQSLRLDLDRDVGRLGFGTSVQVAGRRFDDAANTARLGGYTVVDVRAQYALDQHWLAQLRVANLFDKDYETVNYYNQSGRAVFFTLRYEP